MTTRALLEAIVEDMEDPATETHEATLAEIAAWADRIRTIASSLEGQADDAALFQWMSANCFYSECKARRQPHIVIKVFLGEDEKGRMGVMHPGHTPQVGVPSLRTAIAAARTAQSKDKPA